MTQQISFSEIEYDAKKKQTRRDVLLAKMETLIPFARLVALIALHYPTSGRRGRPPLGIEHMRRMKARVRARVEHPFHVIKNLFHHRKTHYPRRHPQYLHLPGHAAICPGRASCAYCMRKSGRRKVSY